MKKRLLIAAVLLSACSSNDDKKTTVAKPEVTAEDKEELVASDNGLKKQVEALRKEVDALKADVQSSNDSVVQNIFQVVADVAGIESKANQALANIDLLKARLDQLEADITAVTATTSPQLWLYDGNQVRQRRVVGLTGDSAAVQLDNGSILSYQLGDLNSSEEAPANTDLMYDVFYSGSNCSGNAYGVKTHNHRAGALYAYIHYIGSTTSKYYSFITTSPVAQRPYLSRTQPGVPDTCTNQVGNDYFIPLQLFSDISSFVYPNPLTVGR